MGENVIGMMSLISVLGIVVGYCLGWVVRGRSLEEELTASRLEALDAIRDIEGRGDLEIFVCGRRTSFEGLIGRTSAEEG